MPQHANASGYVCCNRTSRFIELITQATFSLRDNMEHSLSTLNEPSDILVYNYLAGDASILYAYIAAQ